MILKSSIRFYDTYYKNVLWIMMLYSLLGRKMSQFYLFNIR